jgi:hypothetical protein
MYMHGNRMRINVKVARTGAHENFKVQHECTILFFYSQWCETESLGIAATTGLLYQPQMIGDGDCEETGLKFGRENRHTWRKPAPAPLCPPQIPHD